MPPPPASAEPSSSWVSGFTGFICYLQGFVMFFLDFLGFWVGFLRFLGLGSAFRCPPHPPPPLPPPSPPPANLLWAPSQQFPLDFN